MQKIKPNKLICKDCIHYIPSDEWENRHGIAFKCSGWSSKYPKCFSRGRVRRFFKAAISFIFFGGH